MMPNDAKTGTSSTQYYTSSSTESMKIDISNYDNIYKTFSGEKPVKKKKENKKEFAEELQSFNCDGCGNRFKGLYSEMKEMKIYQCIKCEKIVEHPDNPSICDYWFVNGKFVCTLCQRKEEHKKIENHIKKHVIGGK